MTKPSSPSILDPDALASDLRLASSYAARAGLLRDAATIDRLTTAEQGLAAGRPDMQALTQALNDVAQAISPMTLADLRSGRDPFEPLNQRSARTLQLWLAIFALITMVVIAHMVESLRIEKTGLKAMEQLQATQLTQKSIALRKMAQLDDPLAKPSSADLYRQKLAEWVVTLKTRRLLDQQIAEANNTSLLPPPRHIFDALWSWSTTGFPSRFLASGVATVPASGSSATESGKPVPASGEPAYDPCTRDANGALALPADSNKRPGWMKNLMMEFIEDLCFRNEVLLPLTGDEVYVGEQDASRNVSVAAIESRMSKRTEWLLPSLFGCLGAIIFVMRNIANIRTPAMELFPMIMRIVLGGIAGIVMGWFSSAALPSFTSTNALSVPFAIAFLTGYGIDALFNVLDRMSRGVAAGAQHAKASSPSP